MRFVDSLTHSLILGEPLGKVHCGVVHSSDEAVAFAMECP